MSKRKVEDDGLVAKRQAVSDANLELLQSKLMEEQSVLLNQSQSEIRSILTKTKSDYTQPRQSKLQLDRDIQLLEDQMVKFTELEDAMIAALEDKYALSDL